LFLTSESYLDRFHWDQGCESAAVGGLMSYGADFAEPSRVAGIYVGHPEGRKARRHAGAA
jgi:hypothetical protein